MNRSIITAAALAAVAMSSSRLSAAEVYWKGGTGNLTDANYTSDGSNSVAPNSVDADPDLVWFGFGGTGTLSTSLSIGKLRVGHSDASPVAGLTGTGNVTVNNGAVLDLTTGDSGTANAALWVGNTQNGTLNIDNATVNASRLVLIGTGSNVNRNGTLNILNGGALNITAGNLNLGDQNTSSANGVQGRVTMSGATSSITFGDNTADLNIGRRNAVSSFTMTGGTVSGGDVVEVGTANSDGDGTAGNPIQNGSFLTISGGSITHGGNFFVGRGTTTNATVNLSGTGIINTGGRFLMGGQTATGMTVNQTGGTLNTTLDVRVGDASAAGTSTYNLSGTGVINATTGGIVARQGTGIFNQTGGTANFNGTLFIAKTEGAPATPANGLYKISAGDLNVTTALSIASAGTGQFRVVGDDSTIDVTGDFLNGNTASGVGTLAFELETGDLLSMINVTGTATFSSGSSLVFDATNAAPTQTVYNLLTATSIIDNGISFSQPGTSGWTYHIIPGGNGQILQVVVPEPTTLGLTAMAGLFFLRRRRA
jgi:hypothetical protein